LLTASVKLGDKAKLFVQKGTSPSHALASLAATKRGQDIVWFIPRAKETGKVIPLKVVVK